MSVTKSIRDALVGVLTGVASMLPGVSGAVILVCFGVYERLIGDLADIRHRFWEDRRFFFTVCIGVIIGMLVSSIVLDSFMKGLLVISLFFFVGLILGQLPELAGLLKACGRSTSYDHLALICGLVIAVSFVFINGGDDVDLGKDTVSFVLTIVIGIVFAVSKIAPGISGSTVLLAIGLYQPMLDSIAGHDMFLLAGIAIGLVIGLFGFAKVMKRAIDDHRSATYHVILGLTMGSVVVIAYQILCSYNGAGDIAFGVIALIVGIAASLGMMRLAKRCSE